MRTNLSESKDPPHLKTINGKVNMSSISHLRWYLLLLTLSLTCICAVHGAAPVLMHFPPRTFEICLFCQSYFCFVTGPGHLWNSVPCLYDGGWFPAYPPRVVTRTIMVATTSTPELPITTILPTTNVAFYLPNFLVIPQTCD